MHPDRIQELAAAYPGEWVLIRITQFDEPTTTPLDGEVVCHLAAPDEVYARAKALAEPVAVLYVPTLQEQVAPILIHVHRAL